MSSYKIKRKGAQGIGMYLAADGVENIWRMTQD